MADFQNPAMEAFLQQLGNETTWGQVLLQKRSGGYRLCHAEDCNLPTIELRAVSLEQVRQLAQLAGNGAFRPLKSSPNLPRGWKLDAGSAAELETVLNQLYPGSVADWFAARSTNPPTTHFREFVARQSGMYRITAKLNDLQAAPIIRACCHESLCLKRRLWSADGLMPDSPEVKSAIPCLEPCAIFLELARKAARVEQEDSTNLPLKPSEAATVIAALEAALAHPASLEREADLNEPCNPRRLRLVLEKLKAANSAELPSADAKPNQ